MTKYIIAAHHHTRDTVYLNTCPWTWHFKDSQATQFTTVAAAERGVEHIIKRIGTTSRIEIKSVA